MFDHVGFPVSDLANSRTFYVTALAPLSIGVIVESPEWVAFGKSGRAHLWLSGSGTPPNRVHLAFVAASRADVRAFYSAALGAGGIDNGAPRTSPALPSQPLRRVRARSRRPQRGSGLPQP